MPRIYDFRVESITPNRRYMVQIEALEALTADINQRGQLEPIAIIQCQTTYRIVDGEKRWRAVKKLGQTSIKAVME
ncbi:MAG: ParB N-terminal domain-containing protein [Desulfohalobiaceae bacterium]|nr:ParB N-terminal domain-containing protein [Desulfohalobiaceae bacterium]